MSFGKITFYTTIKYCNATVMLMLIVNIDDVDCWLLIEHVDCWQFYL